jgi:hypothetical protein
MDSSGMPPQKSQKDNPLTLPTARSESLSAAATPQAGRHACIMTTEMITGVNVAITTANPCCVRRAWVQGARSSAGAWFINRDVVIGWGVKRILSIGIGWLAV